MSTCLMGLPSPSPSRQMLHLVSRSYLSADSCLLWAGSFALAEQRGRNFLISFSSILTSSSAFTMCPLGTFCTFRDFRPV